MDIQSDLYKAWHQEHSTEPVQERQFQDQVQAAHEHLQRAQFSRVIGDLPTARLWLRHAASERRIAAQMPRVRTRRQP